MERIEKAWRRRSLVWLSGVRRAGKTSLCQGLEGVEYLDCELPRVRRMMEDPEEFLGGLKGKRVVLDEVHRLSNPSELLKIAADHFPSVRVIATGSSTLGASRKFRDTLAGRKTNVWLTPMTRRDLEDFRTPDLRRRFLRGGLPPFFLAEDAPEADFQEWMDAYWAKDIQELFRLEQKHAFQRFVELVLARSGGMFEATSFARPCEVSRSTISNHLKILEETHVAHVIRPFSTHRPTEIVSQPKVYGFDTGFVCAHKGWTQLRPEDLGPLWEHFVLNELNAHGLGPRVGYWRDKQGHEIDFILSSNGRAPVAVECKWKAAGFDPGAFRVFRRQYPKASFFLVAADADRPYRIAVDDFAVQVTSDPVSAL